MAPDSFETFKVLETNISDVKAGVARIEGKLVEICKATSERRVEQRSDHEHCQSSIHGRLNAHEAVHEDLRRDITDLSIKFKVITGLGSAIVVVLTLLNILLALGAKLS